MRTSAWKCWRVSASTAGQLGSAGGWARAAATVATRTGRRIERRIEPTPNRADCASSILAAARPVPLTRELGGELLEERAALAPHDVGGGRALAVRDVGTRPVLREHSKVLLVAALLQHVMQRGHALQALEIHVGTELQQLLCAPEAAPLHREQERRRVFRARVERRAVPREQTQHFDVVVEGGGPEAMVGIGTALEQELRKRDVLAPSERIPKRRRSKVLLGERRVLEAQAGVEQHTGGRDTVRLLQAERLHRDAAGEMQPRAAALVPHTEQR